jgi:cold shock CspA family protein
MKKYLAPLSAALFALSLSAAQADEAGGKVVMLDEATGTITLEDGTAFVLSEGVSMDGLEPGTEVTVSYEQKDDGSLVATEVMPNQ